MKLRFTEAKLKSHPLPAKNILNLFDESLSGFGARISAGGGRSYFVRAKRKEFTIGKVGSLALEEARKLARAKLNEIYSGIKLPSEITLRDAFSRYATERGLRASSVNLRRRMIEHHSPKLWDRPLREITPDTASRTFHSIDGKGAANSWAKGLSAIWTHNAAFVSLPENPVLCLTRARALHVLEARETMLRPEQCPDFIKEAMNIPDAAVRGLILTLLFTGMRLGEASRLRWSDVDRERGVIVIPADSAKTGKSRVVPITRQLALVLDGLPDWSKKYLFGSKRAACGHVTDPSFAINELAEGLTPHSLRRTWASIGASLPGVPYVVLRTLGGWSNKSSDVVIRHYARIDDSSLAKGAKTIADAIERGRV
jgi:integrase